MIGEKGTKYTEEISRTAGMDQAETAWHFTDLFPKSMIWLSKNTCCTLDYKMSLNPFSQLWGGFILVELEWAVNKYLSLFLDKLLNPTIFNQAELISLYT